MKRLPPWALGLLFLIVAVSAVELFVLSQRVTEEEAHAYLDGHIAEIDAQLGPDPVPPTIGDDARTPEERWRGVLAAAATLSPRMGPAEDAWWDGDLLERLTQEQRARILERAGAHEALALLLAPSGESAPAAAAPVNAQELLDVVQHLRLQAAGPGPFEDDDIAALEAEAQLCADLLVRSEHGFWRVGAAFTPGEPGGRRWVAAPQLDGAGRERLRRALVQLESSFPSPKRVLLAERLFVMRTVKQSLDADPPPGAGERDRTIRMLQELDLWWGRALAATEAPDPDERWAGIDALRSEAAAFPDPARSLALGAASSLETLRDARRRNADAVEALTTR